MKDLEAAVDLLIDAADKVLRRAPGEYFTRHRGGCVGGVDVTSCACGTNDLKYAVEHLRYVRSVDD